MMMPPVPKGEQPTFPLGVTDIADTGINRTIGATVELPKKTSLDSSLKTTDSAMFETGFKIIATISNIVLQISPLRMVTDMRLEKSTMGYSAAPLTALTACGYQWSFYGYFAFSVTDNLGFLTLVYANVLGLVLGLYYVATYYVYSSASVWSRDNVAFLVLFLLEAVYCTVFETNVERALILAGLLSAALSILVSLAPMMSLATAVATKSTHALPVDIIVASFISSVLWTALGFSLGDRWVWLPNLTGTVLGLVQFTVIAYIYHYAVVDKWLNRTMSILARIMVDAESKKPFVWPKLAMYMFTGDEAKGKPVQVPVHVP
jgi:solute carrier family 50 protein (sugar transporter)